MARERIIIIEDEEDILEVLEFNLTQEGFEVKSSQRGEAGLDLIRQLPPDMLLLDLILPDMDGLDVCRRVRSDPATASIPIVVISAKGKESDVILGLGLGADDYITKPFSISEVVARVKAVLRRSQLAASSETPERIVRQGVVVDVARHEVRIDRQLVTMTATEFRLLCSLASCPGRVFTREHLREHAIGNDVTVLDRNVDVHIASLRKKLGRHRSLIETVWGVGYRFRDVEG